MKPFLRRGPAVALLAAVAVSACGFLPEEEEVRPIQLPEPPKVAQNITYPVERTDIYDAYEGTARVNPTRSQALYFLVAGRVQRVEVQPNDRVKAGQLVAKLEIDALEYQLAIAELDLDIAGANLDLLAARSAPVVEQRIQKLMVEKQQLSVQYLRKRIDSATIRAPFDGIIVRVQAKISDQVGEYEPIIELSDPTELELQMNVSENEFYDIDPSMIAEIEMETDVWSPVRILQTTHANPRLDATVQREEFVVHMALLDPAVTLILDDRMPARIILRASERALVIPSAALREFSGRTYVRVLEGEVRREVDVSVGIKTQTRVEIKDGLEEGELVIGK